MSELKYTLRTLSTFKQVFQEINTNVEIEQEGFVQGCGHACIDKKLILSWHHRRIY